MECCLARGELMRVDGEKGGVVLRCTSGIIWLTSGDGRDYLLSAGKSFAVGARVVVVAEELQASECTLAKLYLYSGAMQTPVIRLAAC